MLLCELSDCLCEKHTHETFQEFEAILKKKWEKNKEERKSVLEIARSSAFLKPLSYIGPLTLLVELGGMNMLTQYLTTIFQKSGSSIDSSIAPIAVAGTRMAIGCVAFIILRLVRPWNAASCSLN